MYDTHIHTQGAAWREMSDEWKVLPGTYTPPCFSAFVA
jgi:hypothetical protein